MSGQDVVVAVKPRAHSNLTNGVVDAGSGVVETAGRDLRDGLGSGCVSLLGRHGLLKNDEVLHSASINVLVEQHIVAFPLSAASRRSSAPNRLRPLIFASPVSAVNESGNYRGASVRNCAA